MDLIHGGDIVGYRERYGRAPLDFSASLNPFGVPPGVLEAVRRAAGEAAPYPDPLSRELTAALASRLGVAKEQVFLGNGAADVVYRFALAAKNRVALIPVPTFAEYERALRVVGCDVRFHFLRPENGFRMGEDVLDSITSEVDTVFLCQPNNPTGVAIEPELLAAILERCRRTETMLFLDECFCDFMENPERYSLLSSIEAYRNLFILGSFTKLYGMAGIRLGYGVCGDVGLAARLHAAGQPWAVSNLAQAAGLAALAADDYVARSLPVLRTERDRLAAALAERGFDVIGDAANYVFFRAADSALDRKLMEQGVLIRNCGNFSGLEGGYFRVAVRLERENEQLLRAMDSIQANG